MTRLVSDYKPELSDYRDKNYRIGKDKIKYNEILRTLNNELLYPEFKSDAQELITLKTLNGESVFGVLATGSGKSTIFLLPAFLRRKIGFTLVVSPLKALMDQFAQRSWVAAIHSDIENKLECWKAIEDKKIHLLLVAPETLRNPEFKNKLIKSVKRSGRKLDSFVLDEVHCVSDWGHDFRAEYWWVAEHLFELEEMAGISHVQRVLLTATANEKVEEEVLDLFGFGGTECLPKTNIIRGLATRPEIYLSACACINPEEKFKWAKKFLERQANRPLPPGTKRRVLVYTREAVDKEIDIDDVSTTELMNKQRLKANQIAELLEEKCSSKSCKIKTMCFSSKGMEADEKKDTQRFFEKASDKKGQVRVVVATSAFGMGMDYEYVPGVLHFYPRNSLSEYWQQVGRAGRGFSLENGEWAEALALYTEDDMTRTYFQAQAHALDGIINSFTIPALGLLVAWDNPPGSSKLALKTPTERQSKFAKFLEYLQDIDILGRQRELTVFPEEYGTAWGFPVNITKLRKIQDELKDLVKENNLLSKHIKKYIRYLRIASKSTPKKFVRLDQSDYDLDRSQTVLPRLSRWADVGALDRDYNLGDKGIVTFRVKNTKLTQSLVNQLIDEWEIWANSKEDDFILQEEVLKARDHIARCKIINKYYCEKTILKPVSAYSRENPDDNIPDWLR